MSFGACREIPFKLISSSLRRSYAMRSYFFIGNFSSTKFAWRSNIERYLFVGFHNHSSSRAIFPRRSCLARRTSAYSPRQFTTRSFSLKYFANTSVASELCEEAHCCFISENRVCVPMCGREEATDCWSQPEALMSWDWIPIEFRDYNNFNPFKCINIYERRWNGRVKGEKTGGTRVSTGLRYGWSSRVRSCFVFHFFILVFTFLHGGEVGRCRVLAVAGCNNSWTACFSANWRKRKQRINDYDK